MIGGIQEEIIVGDFPYDVLATSRIMSSEGRHHRNFSRSARASCSLIFHQFGVLLVPWWDSGGHPGARYPFFDDFGRYLGGHLESLGLLWHPPWVPLGGLGHRGRDFFAFF